MFQSIFKKMSKNKETVKQSIEYDTNDTTGTNQIFHKRKYPTLESVESFVPPHDDRARGRGSGSTEHERHSGDVRARGKSFFSHGHTMNVPRTSNISNNSSRKNRQSVRAKHRRKTANSGGSAGQNYDVHNHYYAGIGHSDLDIQTGRPPLMFQMNFVEWLWFQSGHQQRSIFMLVGVLFFIVLLQFFFGVYLMFTPELNSDPYLCKTDECNYLSKRLRETINKSVDPCDDFYGFVCGSSEITYNLPKEEDDNWNYGYENGRVIYDFPYSETLGFMLKKTKLKPDRLVLDMYQACLEDRSRNKLGLQPYFTMLEHFRLYKFSRTSPLKASDVVYSMAHILSHSFHSSAILRVNFYKENPTTPIRAYIEPAITEPFLAGAVFRYGYKRYHDTIRSVFSAMKTELGITDEELDVLPHDITCWELYFFRTVDVIKDDKKFEEVVADPDNTGSMPCQFGEKFTGTITANFGNDPNGEFDFDLLIREMFAQSNPKWDKSSRKTPFGTDFEDATKDSRTHQDFLELFSLEFSRSAPIRIMRYLQWRVFSLVAFQLNDAATNLMIDVERQYVGKNVNCFHSLFSWLPFLAQHTFVHNARQADERIIEDFEFMLEKINSSYYNRAHIEIVTNMEETLKKTFSSRQKEIIKNIILTHLRADTVIPVDIDKFSQLDRVKKLYEGMEFDRDEHLKNIQKMGALIHKWKTNPDYELILLDYKIDSKHRVSALFDKSVTQYDRITNFYRIYLPMAIAENPFNNDGLKLSDFGGLGLEIAGNLEKTFYSSLILPQSQEYLHDQFAEFKNPPTREEVDDLELNIIDYHDAVKKQFQAQIEEYDMGNKPWKNIKYKSVLAQILTNALHDQSRYQALAFTVNLYLHSKDKNNSDTSWVDKKSHLKQLEEYNLRQIFYMSLVNRRCEKIGPKKFAQISEYGPLPQAITNNLALSNVEDFADVFKCPIGSRMNRKDKVSFWNKKARFQFQHEKKY